MKQINLKLTIEEHKKIKIKSIEQELSMQDYIKKIIREKTK